MIALKDSLGSDFVERVRAFFSENGPLSKAKNFEFRPQQQEMAAAVATALEEERHLVVEAGTGVGKSLAYLTPAILWAIEQNKKAIVSTHTINLQEQLLYKDIPILKKILPVEFEAALIKGRQNYLCPRRLERALQQANELFTGPEQNELKRLAEWARTTRDGSLSDLSVEPDPKVWIQVCSEAHICTQKTCGQDHTLFLSASAQTSAGRRHSGDQSHACSSCCSATRNCRRSARAVSFFRTIFSFWMKRTPSSRLPRGSRHRRFAIWATIDDPAALQCPHAQGPVHRDARCGGRTARGRTGR